MENHPQRLAIYNYILSPASESISILRCISSSPFRNHGVYKEHLHKMSRLAKSRTDKRDVDLFGGLSLGQPKTRYTLRNRVFRR